MAGKNVDVSEYLPMLHDELGIPNKFIGDFLAGEDDDWAFIIKTNALIESVVNVLVTSAIGNEAVSDIVARMDLLDRTTGKMAFLEKMDLISKPHRRFITVVGGIRNKLVHNVSNVNFDLEKYVEDLDANQKSIFLDGVRGEFSNKKINPIIADAPKQAIVIGVLMLLLEVIANEDVKDRLDMKALAAALMAAEG